MSRSNINTFLASLDGSQAGGCDQCNAEQEIRNKNGVWHMTIKHDAWCPFLKTYNKNKPKTQNGLP